MSQYVQASSHEDANTVQQRDRVINLPTTPESPAESPNHSSKDPDKVTGSDNQKGSDVGSAEETSSVGSSSVGRESDLDSSLSPPSPVPSVLTFTESSSAVDIDEFLGPLESSSSTRLPTYKLVGDNIDKNVRPREMRSDNQTRSLHYFHTYALRDRLDLSDVSNKAPATDIAHMQVEALLPSASDKATMIKHFSILIARVLSKYIPYFEKLKCLERHIRHEFSNQMSKKSEVVSSIIVTSLLSLITDSINFW